MTGLTRKENIGLLDRFAPVLVALAFLGVVISYPLGTPGEPLVGSAFTSGFALPAAYLSGVAGAVVLSRRFVASQDSCPRRLAVRAAVAAVVLAAINAYVVVATGFAPLLMPASVAFAAVVAAIDELAGGFFH